MRLPRLAERPPLVLLGLVGAIAAATLYIVASSEPSLTIAIHRGVEGVPLTALAREFSRARHVTVEVIDLPYEQLYEAEMREVSGTVPHRFDVMLLDDPWLPALIGEDLPNQRARRVEKLGFDRRQCGALALDDFVPATLQVSVHPLGPLPPPASGTASVGPEACDALFGVPFSGNSQLFLSRGDRPADWAAVVTSQPGASPLDPGYVLRAGPGNSIVTDFMPMLWSAEADEGAGVRPVSGRPAVVELPALEEVGTRAAFGWLAGLGRRPQAHRSVVSVDDFDVAIQLVKDQASTSIAWAAWVMAMTKLPPPYGVRLAAGDAAPAAALRVGQVPGPSHALGAWLLAIPAGADAGHKARAREFLQYATARPQLVAAALRGNPPPRTSVFADPAVRQAFPWFDEQLQSLRTARPRPRTPLWRKIELVLGDCLSALYDGAVDEDAAWRHLAAGLAPIQADQREIAALRAQGSDARTRIRAILDRPAAPFSCAAAGADGTTAPPPPSPPGPALRPATVRVVAEQPAPERR